MPRPYRVGCHTQYLAECRASLLAGLKRYFRFKAAEGLLSKASLRALEYACDRGLTRPGQPLMLWKEVRPVTADDRHSIMLLQPFYEDRFVRVRAG